MTEATTPDCCEVIITGPDADWLAVFSRSLVDQHLCASVQTVESVRSVYRWKGQVHEATEARTHLRTRLALVPRIVAATRQAHPYEEPSIVAVPLVGGSPSYLQWIRDQTVTDESPNTPSPPTR
jgi:periplasmic divalent cation tolerance protein